MADFNPDQFLAETAPGKGSFDPDQFLKETSPGAKPQQRTDVGDALLRGGVSGASAGFNDELSGALEALGSKVGVRGLAGPINQIHGETPDEAKESFGEAYHHGRDATRQRYQDTQAEHPYTYGGAQIAGGIAAPLPGGGVKSLGGAILHGAAMGGLAGAGEAKEFTDIPDEAIRGAKWGAGAGAAGKVAGAVASKLRPSKLASVFLNTPEEAIQTYIKNPEAVNNAPTRRELAQKFPELLDRLKRETIEGSQQSRAILDQEGKTIKGSEIADILGGKSQQIKDRLAGISDDPEKSAAASWLDSLAGEYAPKPGSPAKASGLLDASGAPIMSDAGAAVDRELPTNRVKDFLQSLDKQTEWETAPGRFTSVDAGAKQDVRSSIDQLLKSQSPAYTDQMKKVAADSGLLNQVTADTGNGSIQGFDNLFKRIQKDRAFDAAGSIGELDKRLGTDTLSQLKLAEAKEALGKSYTNGSRAVNLYKEMGGKNPLARAAMGAVGATVDKYGAPMARGIVDKSAQLQSMLNSSEGLQKLGPYAKVLKDAASRGNQSLAAAHFVLSQTDSKYNSMINTDDSRP